VKDVVSMKSKAALTTPDSAENVVAFYHALTHDFCYRVASVASLEYYQCQRGKRWTEKQSLSWRKNNKRVLDMVTQGVERNEGPHFAKIKPVK